LAVSEVLAPFYAFWWSCCDSS